MGSIPQFPSNKIAGIYGIIHVSTSRIYIGSAISIAKRWKKHIHQLNAHAHENHYLQQAWNKYGPDAFEWIILEEIADKSLLIPAEQKWMDYYQVHNPDKGFNICPTAGSPLGRKYTKEQKEQIGIRSRARQKAYHCILTEQDVRQIIERRLHGATLSELATDFNVTLHTIHNITKRKSWRNLKFSPEIEQALLIPLRIKHKTYLKGSQIGTSKLTESDIPLIRQRLSNGESGYSIARSYGVNHTIISDIKLGEIWTHVPL